MVSSELPLPRPPLTIITVPGLIRVYDTSDPSYIFPDALTNNAPEIDVPPPTTLSAI